MTAKPPHLPRAVRPPPLPRPIRPPPLPPEAVLPQQILSIIFLLAKLAKTDGTVSMDEVTAVDTFFRDVLALDPEKRELAIEAFKLSKESPVPYEDIARELRDFVAGNVPMLHSVIEMFMIVSLADGPLNSHEDTFIARVASIFGLGDSAYTRYKYECEAFDRKRRETREQKRRESLKRLGLNGEPTLSQIKKAHRELVLQCHPDRIQHLGPRLRDIAEEEMKRINQAYDFLCEEEPAKIGCRTA